MSLHILKPGLQTTLQGVARRRYRHMGMPDAGPADPLSMALANRLVENPATATALEIAYGNLVLEFTQATAFAITGAPAPLTLNQLSIPDHMTQFAKAGDTLEIGMASTGARLYLAIAGGLVAETLLGSPSTYLPAEIGGHRGRALQAGDVVDVQSRTPAPSFHTTPLRLRPHIDTTVALRAVASAEHSLLSSDAAQALFSNTFTAAAQINRMGITLEGTRLDIRSDGKMKSAPVFPGMIQCPQDGKPIILMVDAGTTGGYPRIASIARCDQHQLGQIRPRSHVHLIARTQAQAAADYAAKSALLRTWLPDFQLQSRQLLKIGTSPAYLCTGTALVASLPAQTDLD